MRFTLRYATLMTAILLSILLASCGCSNNNNDNGGTSAAGGSTIVMKNIQFSPESITVDAGTTVTWVNEDPVKHNVISSDGLFASGDISNSETFSYNFDKPGTYEYQCTLHPPNMKGTVVVK